MQPSLKGSPSATLVNVEDLVDLLPPSLMSGVVSSSMATAQSEFSLARSTTVAGTSTGPGSIICHMLGKPDINLITQMRCDAICHAI